MAFKLACQYAFREAFGRAKPVILEPVMDVDVRAPAEFQGTIIGDLNRRKGVILNSEGELDDVVMKAQVLPWLCSASTADTTRLFPLLARQGMHVPVMIDISIPLSRPCPEFPKARHHDHTVHESEVRCALCRCP